jgi:dipeptidyl aminopeptidase/acylaminoacyl peptidase
VLAYRTGDGRDVRELAWLDRGGQREGTIGTPAGYRNPRLSPDGRRLAVHRAEGGGDIWVTELGRGASTRVTSDPASDNVPLWSPDGAKIAFVSNRAGGVFDLYWKSAGGTGPEELLLKSPHNKLLNDWSPDGQYVLYQEDDPQTKTDLWMLPLAGDRKPARLLATPFNESEAALSPDGRWMAYMSDESGERELFFDAGSVMSAVSVTAPGPPDELRLGQPQPLFRGLLDEPPHNFDIANDGRRFLVLLTPNTGAQAATEVPVTVVVNWKSGLALSR